MFAGEKRDGCFTSLDVVWLSCGCLCFVSVLYWSAIVAFPVLLTFSRLN